MANIKAFICVSFLLTALFAISQEQTHYPYSRKDSISDIYFGTAVTDNYQWLENTNDSSVLDWVKQQNSYTQDYFSRLPYFHKIEANLKSKFIYFVKVPYRRLNGYAFDFLMPDKKDAWKYNPILYYTTEHEGWVELVNPMSLKNYPGENVVITDYNLSPDEKFLVFSISRNGSDWNELFTVDMRTKKITGKPILWVKFNSITWYNSGFFYNRYYPPTEGLEHIELDNGYSLCYHKLSDLDNNDIEFNIEGYTELKAVFDNNLFVAQEKTINKKPYRLMSVITLQNDSMQNSKPRNFLLYPSKNRYSVDLVMVKKDSVIVRTNLHASNGMIAKYSLNALNRFDTVVKEYKEVLTNAFYFDNKLNCVYEKDFKYYMTGFTTGGVKEKTHFFSEFSSVSFHNADKRSVMFFDESTFSRPEVVCQFNFDKYTSNQVSDTYIRYEPREYVTQLIFCNGNDGAKIPVTLFYKKGLGPGSPKPLLLEVYGGFGIINNPSYSFMNLLWVESGGIFAVAHVRGGGEKGRNWHFAAIRTEKQKSIDDLLSVSQFLIDSNYTRPDKLALTGSSNGGLLVAAAAMQKPRLYKAVLADVGVYDMLRYHRFTIGRGLMDEYGSSDDSAEFKALFSYSPLHNVKNAVSYPAFLITTGSFDDRVPPFHSFKLAAMLQSCSYSKSPVLLHVGTNAGHLSASRGTSRFSQDAYKLSFLFSQMGIEPRLIK